MRGPAHAVERIVQASPIRSRWAYEEVDQHGHSVPGTQKPAPDTLAQFDPSEVTVCLPLGPRQSPVTEQWELIQLSTENHNFHLHQTRFTMPEANGGVVQDNFPLGVATPDATIADTVANVQNGVCTIAQWRSGHCATPPEVVSIQSRSLAISSTTATSSSTEA